MASYVLYVRAKGVITRNSRIILRNYSSIEPYVYEQTLVGWPETKVFWEKEHGDSTGLALVNFSFGKQ
ncbi:MAG TPA: hypothetical protein VHB01_03120 [Nitrosospira sp.]|jgi:hypothetical protein|nr:hypothetical protein [Nitrosospira sp.]